MSSQDIEMQISQYADGSLPAPARANLETSLKREPHLRDVLNEYRQLDASLSMLATLPAVQWEAFADRISSSVASSNMLSSEDAQLENAAVAGRIDGALARTAWMRSGLAAGLLLTLCSGALLWRSHSSVLVAPAPVVSQNVASSTVTGPNIDPASGPVLVQVNVSGAPVKQPSAVQTAEVTTAPKSILAGDVHPNANPADKIH